MVLAMDAVTSAVATTVAAAAVIVSTSRTANSASPTTRSVRAIRSSALSTTLPIRSTRRLGGVDQPECSRGQ